MLNGIEIKTDKLTKYIYTYIHKIEPHDPAIQLLGIYTEELKAGTRLDVCTPMFVVASATAKRWKQFKCPSMY